MRDGLWAELECRIELPPPGATEGQQAASLREIADGLAALYLEDRLGLLDIKEGAEHLTPGNFRHGQQGGPPS